MNQSFASLKPAACLIGFANCCTGCEGPKVLDPKNSISTLSKPKNSNSAPSDPKGSNSTLIGPRRCFTTPFTPRGRQTIRRQSRRQTFFRWFSLTLMWAASRHSLARIPRTESCTRQTSGSPATIATQCQGKQWRTSRWDSWPAIDRTCKFPTIRSNLTLKTRIRDTSGTPQSVLPYLVLCGFQRILHRHLAIGGYSIS